MKTSAFRRAPRQIAGEEDISLDSNDGGPVSGPNVKRPTFKARKSTTPRISVGVGTSNEDDEEEDTNSGVVAPKRSALSRIAIQRNASKRTSSFAAQLPARREDDDHDHDERPSYSAASLRELRDSTPSTPRELTSLETRIGDDDGQISSTLDLSSKFGSALARYSQGAQPSSIPSAMEIAEKKARRARLAKEQMAEEYISLDPDDPDLDEVDDDENTMLDERGRLVLKPKDKYGQTESRLVRDDEDIMENFDEYTEDGKMPLGAQAEIEAARKRRQDMANQIAEAEASDSDSGDSNIGERQRNAAFEAAQTRHGTYGGNAISTDTSRDDRPRTPPHISPLPTLDGALARLRKQLADMQALHNQKLKDMADLRREKVRLGEEEVRIQRNLRETADKFKEIRISKGLQPSDNHTNPVLALPASHAPEQTIAPSNGMAHDNDVSMSEQEQGVDEDDEGAIAATVAASDLAQSTTDFDMPGLHRGGLGMSRPPDPEDDW